MEPARTAAIVVSPILRNRFEKVPLYLQIRIILDTLGNLLFQDIYLTVQIGNSVQQCPEKCRDDVTPEYAY
jgi:hypothetical protein